ncbi:MAG: 50S ribosomal protein L18 [Bdellovibrionaceae bacterium]|nr:50S ribosomal protein L18 [Pseudobdellovibrionaceae bacterium]
MSIKLKNKTAAKVTKRLKSRARIRKKVKGTEERPRLTVFRSGRHIYAQVIDDVNGRTLASSSTLATKSKANNIEVAKAVGEDVAKKALSKDIKTVVFDRSGYVFHGRIKALADGAREAGLNF